MSAGKKFKEALAKEKPLQLVGCVNAYCALLAERVGFSAAYLSGSGVASTSYGLPDLALTTLDNVLEDLRRISSASTLPLLVDADTGFGSPLMIQRCVKEMTRAGAAGIHIEDQVELKRCGHRDGKKIVSIEEMSQRIKAAIDAKTDPDFIIMARIDIFSNEGLDATNERAKVTQ